MTENLVKWCNNNHPWNANKIEELIVASSTPTMDTAAKKQQILKYGAAHTLCNTAAIKILTISAIARWKHKLISPIEYLSKWEIWSQ